MRTYTFIASAMLLLIRAESVVAPPERTMLNVDLPAGTINGRVLSE